MSGISIEYLAGFMDGEGCFALGTQIKKSNGKEYPNAKILLSQSGPEGLRLLERIQYEYGGRIYHHLKVGEHKATKDAYKLYWNKQDGLEFCRKIIPHLILKKEQAQKVLEIS